MKTITSTLMALALALLLVVPALAGGEGGDTVTKTFKLTVNGEVDDPSDRLFAAFYAPSQKTPAEFAEELRTNPDDVKTYVIVFCRPEGADLEAFAQGGDAELTQVVSEEECQGGGRTYTADVELPQGSILVYTIITGLLSNLDESVEMLATNANEETGEVDFEVLDSDVVNSASYPVASPGMPETGAGGMAGGSLPLGAFPAVASLLAAGIYLSSRRR